MKVNSGTYLNVTWDFRDWKYMSEYIQFSKNISDPEIIAGNKEGSLNLDLSKMVKSD